MAIALNWEMRDAMTHLGEKGRLTVLIDLLLRCDEMRYRCYPSIKKISKDTGLSTSVVDAALDWLVSAKALVKVIYTARVGKEKKLPNRQSVYQLTGRLIIGDKTFWYLFLNPETQAVVEEWVRQADGHISDNEISDNEILEPEISHSETEGISSIKGTSKKKDKSKEVHKPNGNGKPHFSEAETTAMKEAIRAAFKWEAPNGNEWGQIQRAAYDLLASPITIDDVLPLYRFCRAQFTIVKPTTLAGNVSEWRKSCKSSFPAPVPAPYEGDDAVTIPDDFFSDVLKKG
jgi:hypothetical protein